MALGVVGLVAYEIVPVDDGYVLVDRTPKPKQRAVKSGPFPMFEAAEDAFYKS